MSAQTIIRRTALVLTAAALSGLLLPAQAQTSFRSKARSQKVVRIITNGADGEVSYYGVRCANGTRGDVRIEHDTRKTCAVPQGGEARCRVNWTIQAAAERVCAASGR